MSKVQFIAGTWTAIGGYAGFKVYQRIRDFEDKTPCFPEAVELVSKSAAARAALGTGELSIARWPRTCSVDVHGGLARASFELRGENGCAQVFVGARRRAQAQLAYEAALDEEEDDLEAASGWRRYWQRPWELKFAVMNMFRWTSPVSADGNAQDEEPVWDIQSLFVLPGGDVSRPLSLVGEAAWLPEYEALCVRRDAEEKDETSRRRLHVIIGLALGGAVLMACGRVVKSLRVTQGFGFVRSTVVKHQQVAALLGKDVTVQTSSGTFGSKFINARVRLVGGSGAVADVAVSATRDGTGSKPWNVALARMWCGGRSYELDRSQF